MKNRAFLKITILALAGLFCSANSYANDPQPLKDTPLLKGGIGYFDFNKRDNTAAELRLEYQGKKFFKAARPLVGISATTDKSFFAFAGIAFDFGQDGYYFTPSFAPGYYHKGDGKDLGHDLEIRSQVELGYEFEDASRLGFSISHRSNANIGDSNPGAETFNFYYSVPVEALF